MLREVFQKVYIDVGDECWLPNVLVVKHVTNIKALAPTSNNCHQQNDVIIDDSSTFKNHFKFEVNELKVTVESLSKSKSNFDLQTEKLEESITTLKGRGSFQPT